MAAASGWALVIQARKPTRLDLTYLSEASKALTGTPAWTEKRSCKLGEKQMEAHKNTSASCFERCWKYMKIQKPPPSLWNHHWQNLHASSIQASSVHVSLPSPRRIVKENTRLLQCEVPTTDSVEEMCKSLNCSQPELPPVLFQQGIASECGCKSTQEAKSVTAWASISWSPAKKAISQPVQLLKDLKADQSKKRKPSRIHSLLARRERSPAEILKISGKKQNFTSLLSSSEFRRSATTLDIKIHWHSTFQLRIYLQLQVFGCFPCGLYHIPSSAQSRYIEVYWYRLPHVFHFSSCHPLSLFLVF